MALLFLAATVYAQPTSFNRFTDDLPQLLESDAATVMVRGMTYDFAGKLCARLSQQIGQETQTAVAAWRKRNDVFFRGAASALNEIADRHVPDGGEQGKQNYLQMILQTTAKEASRRVMQQMNGANLDNNVVPPERACLGLSGMLRDGAADLERAPSITRALSHYMQRKGIQ